MSHRKCTVTGIDQHQIKRLDIAQCAALVNSNHGYINLIMNEYAYYGKGHTIHSSGQIEWIKKQVDDKHVKVGGSQCIKTLDGYSVALQCTGGLMYLSILGKPTDEELVTYSSVHLTSIYEWATSVLVRSPSRHVIPNIFISLNPILMPMAYIPRGPSIPYHPWLMCFNLITGNQLTHPGLPTPNQVNTSHSDKYTPYVGWVTADTIRDTFKQTLNGESP